LVQKVKEKTTAVGNEQDPFPAPDQVEDQGSEQVGFPSPRGAVKVQSVRPVEKSGVFHLCQKVLKRGPAHILECLYVIFIFGSSEALLRGPERRRGMNAKGSDNSVARVSDCIAE
jgi:hypothetical protein